MTVIEDVCDRVIVMADGRIVADDSVEALLRRADRELLRIESAETTQNTVRAIKSAFGVATVDRSAEGCRLDIEASGEDLYDLMALLRDAGVSIDRIETLDPTLEDVFVDLTGDGGGLSSDDPGSQR